VFRLRDRRGEATETGEGGFRIIIAETRGACVIAIILDASRKFHRKFLGCAGLLIGCHSIPI
jgi:hypothetical protein